MKYSKLIVVVLGALGMQMAGATPTAEEAAQLGKTLTPMGAIKAGNKEGTIPEWTGLWLILCAAAAVWTCRRLGIPWLAVPCVMAWPPFSEALVTGNVQVLSFAAFVALLYEPADGGTR